MELATLLQQLSDNGFSLGSSGCNANTMQVRGPTDRLTPGMRDALRQHKPALLQLLGSPPDLEAEAEREAIQREAEAPPEATAFPFGANVDDWWWDAITESDRERLTAKRRPVGPCYFCGGRQHHHPDCCGMPTMPWGVHAGVPLPEVSDDYLRFVVGQGIGSDSDKRTLHEEWKRRHAGSGP